MGRSRNNTHLVLLFPVDDIVDPAEAAHIDVFAWFHEHVGGRDDKGEGWFARVLACYPYCDGDVVRSLAIVDGQEAMNAKEKVGATVVISYGWQIKRKR